jgi:hypothetical protein
MPGQPPGLAANARHCALRLSALIASLEAFCDGGDGLVYERGHMVGLSDPPSRMLYDLNRVLN